LALLSTIGLGALDSNASFCNLDAFKDRKIESRG
jgi:hypothetical protein